MKEMIKAKEEFINAAISHSDALFKGNYVLGNKLVDKLIVLSEELGGLDEGKRILKELVDHESMSVRLWSSIYSISFNKDKAVNELTKISQTQSFLGTLARLALEDWKNGKVKANKEDLPKNTINDREDSGLDLEIYNQILSRNNLYSEKKYIGSLSKGMQIVYTTMKLEGNLVNGGLTQYFWNTFEGEVEIAIKGYELLGSSVLAEALRKFSSLFKKMNGEEVKKNDIKSLIKSYETVDFFSESEKFLKLLEIERPSLLRNKYIAEHVNDFK